MRFASELQKGSGLCCVRSGLDRMWLYGMVIYMSNNDMSQHDAQQKHKDQFKQIIAFIFFFPFFILAALIVSIAASLS